MKTTALIIILSAILISLIPFSASAAITLVPCGRADQQNKVPPDPNAQCNLTHLIVLLVRMINYLITVAALVAIYEIIGSGFNLMYALGNPEKIKSAKEGISNAVVGFAMIVLAFVFINLVVNGIFGNPSSPQKWWKPECLYVTSSSDCPLNTLPR